jgi:SWI/SNF related-matrix-associated actin-dependent regulator of chromatin subfamily C
MVKLPLRHWRDYTQGGALFVILRRCLAHKHKHQLRRFDWQSEHKCAEFVGMMRQCENDLRDKGVLRRAKVFLSPDVPNDEVHPTSGTLHPGSWTP